MDLGKWLAYLDKAGVVVFMVLALYMGQAGYWVFGYQYADLKADRDQWKDTALKALHVGEERTGVPHVIGANPSVDEVKARLEQIK